MTTDNFDPHQFHDNLLHGISISVEGFRSELHLDLDYIVDWPACESGNPQTPKFSVAKGMVTFYDVTDLCLNINWGTSGYTTAVSGPYIDMVQREKIVPGLRIAEYFKWRVVFTDQRSSITFGASSMSFETHGNCMEVARQYLTDAERDG
jgi:hypothetical protein